MTVPGHLKRFIEANTAVRVAMLCTSMAVLDPRRIGFYTRAVREAVLAEACNAGCAVTEVDAFINGQLQFLQLALQRIPPPVLPRRAEAAPVQGDADSGKQKSKEFRKKNPAADADVRIGKSMEQKLEDARKPMRKILQEDCVQLGLLDPERAKRLSANLAGKKREEAEAELMAELRNNLHQQVRNYMRRHDGGPWNSPQQQEDVRLDIAGTNSVYGVVSLTRHLLQERTSWEGGLKKGRISSLLGGKFRFSNKNGR